MKLDLSHFKLKENDGKIATLIHPDGHEFKVAVNALHPLNRRNLDALTKHKTPKEEVKKSNSAAKKMADGGVVEDESNSSKMPRQDDFDYMINAFTPDANAQKLRSDKELAALPKTPDDTAAAILPQASTASPTVSDTLNTSAAAPTLGVNTSLTETPQPSSAVPSLMPEASLVPATSPTPADPYGLTAYKGNIQNAMNMGLQGTDLAAKAAAQEGKLRAQAAQDQISKAAQLNETFQKTSSRINNLMEHTAQDIANGHINPNHYMESLTTAGRVQTAIGLILGGMGAGIIHQENPALKFLNAQIDRDIAAQQANISNKNNIISAYTHILGNTKDAADMAKATQAQIYAAQIDKAAAQTQDPKAKAAALQAKSEILSKYAAIPQQIAMKQTVAQAVNGSNGDPETFAHTLNGLRMMDPTMAKEMESRFVPHLGLAQVPVPNEVRDQLFKRNNLVSATDHLMTWVKQNGGTLNPQKRAEGEALAAELQQIYRQGVGASTSESEQKIIESIISSKPGAVIEQITTSPKLKALKDSMSSSLNVLKSQYGLPVQKQIKLGPAVAPSKK